MKIEVKDIKDLQKVIECIKKSGKKIIILSGTLGSGKTTLVKEFAKSLRLSEDVTSPTFAIQNIYGGKIYHYDLYNKGADEFLVLGMLEELEKEGYHFIEWGEDLEDILKTYGFDYLKINITLNKNKRLFECQN
ncbi:MAG: tRNA (adenosine(37)-N6)-threonylcarbamoyltransferase complex ATPase subunit type 1 TsaE [Nautiliaceae bacterium]